MKPVGTVVGRPLLVVLTTFNRGDQAADAGYRVRHSSRRGRQFSADGRGSESLVHCFGRPIALRLRTELQKSGGCWFSDVTRTCYQPTDSVGLMVRKYRLNRCSPITYTQEDSVTGSSGLYP